MNTALKIDIIRGGFITSMYTRILLERIIHAFLIVVMLYFIIQTAPHSCTTMCKQICDSCMIGTVNRYTNQTLCVYNIQSMT